MPFTPFFGISVLMHLLVIGYATLSSRVPERFRHTQKACVQKNPRASVPILGFCIIAGVFTFVLVTASILIHTSITESHSSVRILESGVAASVQYVAEHPVVLPHITPIVLHLPSIREDFWVLVISGALLCASMMSVLALLPYVRVGVRTSLSSPDQNVRRLMVMSFPAAVALTCLLVLTSLV